MFLPIRFRLQNIHGIERTLIFAYHPAYQYSNVSLFLFESETSALQRKIIRFQLRYRILFEDDETLCSYSGIN